MRINRRLLTPSQVQGLLLLKRDSYYLDNNFYRILGLTFCTLASSVGRRRFLSHELLRRVPLDLLSCPAFFVKRAKEKEDCRLEIVSGCIVHLKIAKYNDSVNKTGI